MFRGRCLAASLALLMLVVEGTAAQGAAAMEVQPDPWWGWVALGRLHPLVVHFPIGLLIAGAAHELVSWWRGRGLPTEVGTFCLALGLVSGAVAVWFGTLNASHQSIQGNSAVVLEWHRYAGWTVLVTGAGALLAGRLARGRNSRPTAGTYAGLLAAVAVAVAVTGHFGGQLVYGSGYVTSVMPWNREAPPVLAAGPSATAAPASAAPATGPDPSLAPEAPAAPVVESTESPAAIDAPARTPSPSPSPAPATAASASPAPAARPAAPAANTPAAPVARRDEAAPPAPGPAAPPAAPARQDGSAQAPPAAPAAAPVAAASGKVSFAQSVMPLIKNTCVECHGPDKVKARLRMDSVAGLKQGGKSGPLVVPGDPENSLMMRRVLGLDGEDQMPLDNDPLTPEQIEMLRQWIAEGAHYDPS